MPRLFAVLAPLFLALAQSPGSSSGEGPLNNDSFQPTNLTAEELFHGGIADFARGQRDAAFESMRSALANSSTGDGIRLPNQGPDDKLTPRTTLGIEAAVDWFLAGLNEADMRAWTSRFEDLASLVSESDPERHFPGTNAALKSAMIQADRAFEVGRLGAAEASLKRARFHLQLTSPISGSPVEIAITRRESAINLLRAAPLPSAVTRSLPAIWNTATELPQPQAVAFEFALTPEDPYLADLIGNTGRSTRTRTPGSGLRPGLVGTTQDQVAVQTAGAVHILDLVQSKRILVFEPAKLLQSNVGRMAPARAARKGGEPGWAHLPLYRDQNLVMVIGRTEPGRGPNALASINPKTDSESTPVVNWALAGSRLFRGDHIEDPLVFEPLDGAEIQPGTVIVGDQVLFQARVLDGEVKTYLGSVSLTTGAPKWLRLITKGGDLPSASARFSQARLPVGSAAPLVFQNGNVLVQTNLGISALYSASSGRLLWSFKNRRRAASEPGWSGIKPLVFDNGDFAVAPADSDHAYQLQNTAPLPPARAPLAAEPQPIRFNTDQVATQNGDLIRFARPSGERQIIQSAPDGSHASASILLRRDEHFAGLPATSNERVIASSNRGLFLFDRTRELMLLDYLPIPGGGGPRAAGGDVSVLANRLLVLGPGTLWIFELSPTQLPK